MEGRRCRSCPNQNTSNTNDAPQGYAGTCTEESRGPPQAPCTMSGQTQTAKSPRLTAVEQHTYFGSALQLQQSHTAGAKLSTRGLRATVMRAHLGFQASCSMYVLQTAKKQCKWCLVRVFSIFQESLEVIYCSICLI